MKQRGKRNEKKSLVEDLDIIPFNNYNYWRLGDTGSISGSGINSPAILTSSNDNKYYTNQDWMPYVYAEYEPVWHKKFAHYKIQMEDMWK